MSTPDSCIHVQAGVPAIIELAIRPLHPDAAALAQVKQYCAYCSGHIHAGAEKAADRLPNPNLRRA